MRPFRVTKMAQDMVRGLLKVNPKERLKLEDCMVHPWLAGVPPAQARELGEARAFGGHDMP